jgi:HJR/Mrr/RecB family endonuclease
VSVFHGYGETCDAARQSAAQHALKYIRYLSKQQQQQQVAAAAAAAAAIAATTITTPTISTPLISHTA